MPGKVKVKIISGKNLPVMDRSSDTTDAYVEIKLGSTTYKTDVCRKSLHPQWNSEWYRFEVDDSELQDEPLQIRLMDHDTYSANDAIGKVYLNLNPLLLPTAGNLSKYGGYKSDSTEGAKNSVMSGWIPVYDTMHGIRGEVNIVVKVELFYDFNKFRQSSCGVQFFCSPTIPHGFTAQLIHGFVEELIVIDDPEYKWIDKIRTPRASNEARQTLFFKLSGELQRKIGVKALNLGGNAVIAYRQRFDLEGESGIVARGIGTAVTLVKCVDVSHSLPETVAEERVSNYLKFIGHDKNFRLSSKPNLAPLFPKPRSHINPVPFNKKLTKRPKYKQIAKHLSSDTAVLLRTAQSNPSLTDPSFQTLLKQEDRRGTPGSGLSQRIKNLKYSSHSSLSKKMTALKAKLGESGIGEERDEDVESPVSKRKGIFKRTQSENSVMAELLARSVINVHNSLGSVLEDKESSESEQAETPVIKTAKSEPNISSDENVSLKYSNSESSESYEEESEDESVLNFDTISNIVSNVQNLERGTEKLHKQLSLPSFPLRSPAESSSQNTFFFPLTPKDQSDTGSDFYIDNSNFEKGLNSQINLSAENEPFNISKSSDLSQKSLKDEATDTASLKSIKTVTEGTQTDYPFSTGNLPEGTHSEPVSPSNTQIIPPVMMGSSIKSKGLFKTAMQTMLLEKVNIVSTYTPPTSPTLKPDDISLLNEHWQSRHFLPQRVSLAKLPKSNTSISLHDDYAERHNETVLGVPFTAITSLKVNLKRRNSHPCISAQNSESDENKSNKNKPDFMESPNLQKQSCFSDSELHKDDLQFEQKSSFSFLNLIKKSKSHQSLPDNKRQTRKFSLFKHKPRHDEFNAKKRFSFFHKRTSVDDGDCGKSGGKLSKIFHLKHDHGNQAPTNDPESITDKESSVKITEKQSPAIAEDQLKVEESEIDPYRSKISLVFDKSDHKIESLSNAEEENADSNFDTKLITNRHNKLVRQESVNIEIEPDSGYSCSINKQDAFRHNSPPPSSSSTTAQSTCQTTTEPNGTNIKSSPEHATTAKIPNSPAKLNAVPCIHRRSSDSDLSITPKGNSLTGSDRSGGGYIRNNLLMRSTVQQENFDMLEYPFLTMTKYPSGFILQLGGAVSARSVKLLERISNVEEPESRDTWWSEIRMEIRSHARSLNCNAVLGYTETTSICEDVCVLSASGTAAIVGFHYPDEIDDSIGGLPSITKHYDQKSIMTTSLDRTNFDKEKKNNLDPKDSPDHNSTATVSHSHHSTQNCIICHLPYDTNNLPVMRATIMKCNICSKGKVPDVLIATIEPPDNLPNIGRGCFIDSFICRPLKDLRGESIAKDISDGLPFLEYELHRLLVNKLKIKGMNAIFGLKIRISVGEKMLIGIATGTAIYLESLPTPSLPKLVSDRISDEKKLNELQKLLQETVKKNRDIYQLKIADENTQQSESEETENDINSLDLISGNKDCCILEVDDPQDAEVVNLLMEERPPDGFHVVNTESVPGLDDLEIVKNLQMFTQIYRAKLHSPYNLNNHFRRLLQSVYFKLRRMVPCALCDLQFRIDLPEPDELQLCVVGMALGLGKCDQVLKIGTGIIAGKKNDDDLIFKLDEETAENGMSSLTISQSGSIKYKQKSPSRKHASMKQRHIPHKERHGVDITPLSYVPGGKIERYLGNLNFFFIRETTSIREEGGPSGFIHSFMTEVLAIVRAHVTALGGNAMVAYFFTECVLNHNLHKNQGQCLINVGGDVVFVSYFKEDT